MSKKKNYVLDTSVYLTDANAIFKFDNHDIFIPLKVLEEVDNHKKRQDSVGQNARHFIKNLDELRKKGSLEKGIRIEKGKGVAKVVSYSELKGAIFPPDLDMRLPDHTIIATAKTIQMAIPERKTIMVSRDINMRVICDSIGIVAEDFISEKAVRTSDELYNGFVVHLVDEQIIDQYYDGEEYHVDWFSNWHLQII